MPILVRRAEAGESTVAALADILRDVVEGGASVGFMAPISAQRCRTYAENVLASAARGERILLVAHQDDEIVGTVQIVLAMPENQPHRAEIAKMQVRTRAQGQGIGAMLMQAAEDEARKAGKTLLVLDTVTGSAADRLYTRLGWQRVGEIPGYALWPDGRPCPTTVFYKAL